jgi:hypothetical protein
LAGDVFLVNHYNLSSPPLFLHLRIPKDLQERFADLRILKDLRADDFGQNLAKRGICPELRILKDLVIRES